MNNFVVKENKVIRVYTGGPLLEGQRVVESSIAKSRINELKVNTITGRLYSWGGTQVRKPKGVPTATSI